MNFKDRDRVHVTRLNGKDVDLYGALSKQCRNLDYFFRLINCNDKNHNDHILVLPDSSNFGRYETDYYTLATDEIKGLKWSDGSSAEGAPIMCDEEDSDEPDRQSITKAYNKARLKNYEAIEIMQDTSDDKIELDNHYIIEVKEGLYVRNATSNYFFKFTKDINKADVYEYKNAAMKHAEFVDGRVLNLKRYVEVE